MLFPERRFSVSDIDTVDELAEKLTQHSWTLCTGFCLRDPRRTLLFLNDSTSEDGAQEYAVCEEGGRQVESITFGWCSPAEARQHIEELLEGGGLELAHVELRLDEPSQHSCGYCA